MRILIIIFFLLSCGKANLPDKKQVLEDFKKKPLKVLEINHRIKNYHFSGYYSAFDEKKYDAFTVMKVYTLSNDSFDVYLKYKYDKKWNLVEWESKDIKE